MQVIKYDTTYLSSILDLVNSEVTLSGKDEESKYSLDELRDLADNSKTLVLIEDNKFIGFLLSNVRLTYAIIEMIGVSKEYRSKGCAEFLLNEYLKDMKTSYPRINYISAIVSTKNKSAIQLFKNFNIEGTYNYIYLTY